MRGNVVSRGRDFLRGIRLQWVSAWGVCGSGLRDRWAAGGSGSSGGWPNGRRFGDDVVDIALTAMVSGPSYATITVMGDNVGANDQIYHQVFPYTATPHSGTQNRKDP